MLGVVFGKPVREAVLAVGVDEVLVAVDARRYAGAVAGMGRALEGGGKVAIKTVAFVAASTGFPFGHVGVNGQVQLAVAAAAALADGRLAAGGCAAIVILVLVGSLSEAVEAVAVVLLRAGVEPSAHVTMGIRVWCAADPVRRATNATQGGRVTRRCAFGRRTGEHRIPYNCIADVAGG